MVNEAIKITVEEWANENHLSLSDEQISDLIEGIDIARDMSMPCGYGVGQIETREKGEIEKLKMQVDLLERYISSKGYNIILYDDKITRTYMVNWGDRSFTAHENFR